VFGPVNRNHFNSAADTPQKACMAFTQEKKVHYHGNGLCHLPHTCKIDHKLVSSCAEKHAEFNGVKITLIESNQRVINASSYVNLWLPALYKFLQFFKVAQSCHLGNQADFVLGPPENINQKKNFIVLKITRLTKFRLDYEWRFGVSFLLIAL